MSKSIHTTRGDYRTARDEDFGSKKLKDGVLATIRDELNHKSALKRAARQRQPQRQPDVPRSANKRVRFPADEPRPIEKLPLVRLEEFDGARTKPWQSQPARAHR